MEMTIDEKITQLKKLRSFHSGSYGTSINFAIGIMRKYEKIQEIMDSREDDDAKTNSKVLSDIEMIMYEEYKR